MLLNIILATGKCMIKSLISHPRVKKYLVEQGRYSQQ